MADREREPTEPRADSPLGMGGGFYLNEEAKRYGEAVERWRASGYDPQVMVDAGYWALAEDEDEDDD